MNSARAAVRILVAEEEPGVRNLISLALKHQGYGADFAEDTVDALSRLREFGGRYAAVLLDLDGSDRAALELIAEAGRMEPFIPVIGLRDLSSPVSESVKVDETITKPIIGEALRKAIQKVLRFRYPEQGGVEEATTCGADFGGPGSVWRTEIHSLIRRVADADVPVLLRGETGVGKEVLARQIHSLSPRAKKPFLKVNCAALPSELIESELFGYERGAFTGAFKNTPGKFEMADEGTILLDEIGDMDFKLQAKLLQVLQDGEFIRLGSSEPKRVNVRVMAATHCDLERAISENRFREDLYYRLNIISFHIPSLAERRDEILPLAYHFMRRHATAANAMVEISPLLREVLLSHDWPGNIRELENVIRKLLVLRWPDLVAQEMQGRARRRTDGKGNGSFNQPTESSVNPTRPLPPPALEVVSYSSAASNSPAPTFSGMMNSYERYAETATAPRESSFYRGPQSEPIAEAPEDRASVLERVDKVRREAESDVILNALNATLWNRKRAAESLGIDYKALLYKMKKLGIVERAAKIAV
jgi:two-component system response regulator AtoC